MFEQLMKEDFDLALGGIYYAIRRLKHNALGEDHTRTLWYPHIRSEPSAAELDLGELILQEIRSAEGSSIDKQARDRHIGILGDLAVTAARRGQTPDPVRGRMLLEELRRSDTLYPAAAGD